MSRGFRFKMLTPAKSKDFVVLYVSEEMLPSNLNVLGAVTDFSLFVLESDLLVGTADFAWIDLMEATEAASPA